MAYKIKKYLARDTPVTKNPRQRLPRVVSSQVPAKLSSKLQFRRYRHSRKFEILSRRDIASFFHPFGFQLPIFREISTRLFASHGTDSDNIRPKYFGLVSKQVPS